MASASPGDAEAASQEKSEDTRPRAGNTFGAGSFRSIGRGWPFACWALRQLLLVYLGALVVLMFLEESLIFFPSPYPEGNWRPGGLKFEDVEFAAADGTALHGWYLPHPTPRGVVLFCHGNAGNITHREEILRRLHNITGATVFIFDYRGYGRSQGKPTEAGILADARAAHDWLARRENLPFERLVLMGESLGGAVAVSLAAEGGARALILESTFTSLPDVAAHHFPWVPVRLLMRTRLDALAKIKDYRGPLLQSHGDQDTIVPYHLGRRLFEAAHEPKQFITFPGGDHNDLRGVEYYEKLAEFFFSLE